jgi:hypothetical protein
MEERVNYFTCVEEMRKRSDRGRWRSPVIGARSLEALVEISPCSGDKRAASIRKDEDQIQIAFSVRATEKFQGLPL